MLPTPKDLRLLRTVLSDEALLKVSETLVPKILAVRVKLGVKSEVTVEMVASILPAIVSTPILLLIFSPPFLSKEISPSLNLN